MKQKKMKIGTGLNKLVYGCNEIPTDGVKLPLEHLKALYKEGEILGVELSKQMMGVMASTTTEHSLGLLP